MKEQQGKKFNLTRSFDANLFYMNSTRVPNNYVNEKPFRYSPSFFVELLQDTLHKTVERIQYQKPKDITVLYSIDTKTVLREMMLPSDNFFGRAAHHGGRYGEVRFISDGRTAEVYDGYLLSLLYR